MLSITRFMSVSQVRCQNKTIHSKIEYKIVKSNSLLWNFSIVPMSSPLTWKLTGDIGEYVQILIQEIFCNTHLKNIWWEIFSESNQFEVRQNAADSNSPLDCSPECPQEEYVYDYQYADSAAAGDKHEVTNILNDWLTLLQKRST